MFYVEYLSKANYHRSYGSAEILPSIVITALPGSGAELIGWLFYNNPDVAYVQLPSSVVKMPRAPKFRLNTFADACLWTYEDLAKHPQMRTWIQLLRQNLPTFVSDAILDEPDEGVLKQSDVIYKEYTTQDLHEHIVKYPNAQTVLHFTSGSWGLKLPWLHGILGNNLRAIHVVRDPRSWIATFLRDNMDLYKKLNVQEEVDRMFEQADDDCIPNGRYAEEYDKLRERLHELKSAPPHLLLAWLWSSNTQAVLRTVTSLPESNSRLVRFEDLVSNGENTANLVYKFIGFPLPPTMTHQLLQATNSDIYKIEYEGVISQTTVTRWQQDLAEHQIGDIEEVCGQLMEKLGYTQMGPWRFKSEADDAMSKETQ
ncbi:dermatan-sulfate epimerase-like protein [Amphiura filiformis]|uniref:dermatan-sulfate epimerase-like protein n=1 Tax=Amphiura filiformis TaxID=82378 RepID=UPI003B220925